MHMSYSQLEDFLADIHGVCDTKRTALKGRLKHFQRLQWPPGTNQGKGARVKYGIGQTLSLAVAMELLQIGLTPERIVEQLTTAGNYLPDGFYEAMDDQGPSADSVFYMFSPESLQALRGQSQAYEGFQSFLISQSQFHEMAMVANIFHLRRFAVLNLSEILKSFISHFKVRDFESLITGIKNWCELSKNRNKPLVK